MGGFWCEFWQEKQEAATYELTDCVNYGNITGLGYVGGIAGRINTATNGVAGNSFLFRNVVNHGTVTGTTTPTYVGGLFGEINTGSDGAGGNTVEFQNAVNNGTVSGTEKVGGLIGGYTAKLGSLLLTGSANHGAVNASASDSGALLGYARPNGGSITVERSLNTGSLSGGGNNKAGVIGSSNHDGDYTLTVKAFLNTGSITSGSRAAAVTGWLDSAITVEDSISLGSLSGNGDCGGILAFAQDGSVVKNCLSAASVSTTTGSAGILVGGSAEKATFSGNYYKKADSANTTGGETELAGWSDVVAVLNEKYSSTWGRFLLNTDGTGAVLATPKLAGVQDGKATGDTFSVRFIATLQDTLRYERVGFRITVNGGAETEISCKHVYLKLLANEAGGQVEVSASALGGSYLYALTVDGIPATGTVTFTVVPFAVDQAGTENAQTYIGQGYTVTYTNGVFTSATPIA